MVFPPPHQMAWVSGQLHSGPDFFRTTILVTYCYVNKLYPRIYQPKATNILSSLRFCGNSVELSQVALAQSQDVIRAAVI